MDLLIPVLHGFLVLGVVPPRGGLLPLPQMSRWGDTPPLPPPQAPKPLTPKEGVTPKTPTMKNPTQKAGRGSLGERVAI